MADSVCYMSFQKNIILIFQLIDITSRITKSATQLILHSLFSMKDTMSDNIRDRVQRFNKNGIRVVIIGAGVGGLYAALECWRKGCDVVVLEKTDQLSPIG